jgi:tetratricopeptide (TPR) repeat protein
MGDATNLAARLMAKAPPGELYATAGVLGRSATTFERTELPPFAVKGKKRPVTAWSVGPARRSLGSAGAGMELPLVGRAQELAVISSALARARSGAGLLLEISGEAGVGKSRLAQEARGAAGDMRVLRAMCEAYGAGTPYALWRDLLRQSVSLGWEDPDEVVVDRLAREVAAGDPELAAWLPLLAIVFDARAPSTEEVDALAPEFRRARTHDAVLRFLAPQLSVPTLVEIEQAHLMDEASAALLEALAESLAGSSWLVLVTSRGTGSGLTTSSLADVERLAPGPLADGDALVLAQAATEAHPVPPYVVGLAVERAGGNPQFLLDLLALGAQSDRLPDSAEAAAMARIDALDPNDRSLVRRLAVLGMSFHDREVGAVLDAAARPPEDSDWRRLEALVVSDGDGGHRFARATLREAAYAALPFRTRRALHAAVAEQAERQWEATGDGDRAALSWHRLVAGQPERALPHALAAAELAASRSAHADAARLYRRAIEAARASRTPDAELVGVWEALGEALRRTGEPAAAHEAFRAARSLVAEDPIRVAELLYLHAGVASRGGQITAAVRWVGRALRLVEGLESREAVALRARLWSAQAGVRLRQGRYQAAVESARRAIADAEPAGEDGALAHACWVLDSALVRLGRPAEATHSQRAIEIYKRIGDTENLARVLGNLGASAVAAGRWNRALELYEEGAEHAARAGDVVSAAYGDCNIGETLSDQGRFEEAEPRLRRALQVWDGSGDELGSAYARLLLGRLAVRVGEAESGCRRIEGALADLARLRCEFDAAFARVLLAEAAIAAERPDEALGILAGLHGEVERSSLAVRLRALALAARGEAGPARAAFEESLACARESGSDFDAAAALDGLAGLCGDPRAAAALRSERDALLGGLGVARLPGPRLGLAEASPSSR